MKLVKLAFSFFFFIMFVRGLFSVAGHFSNHRNSDAIMLLAISFVFLLIAWLLFKSMLKSFSTTSNGTDLPSDVPPPPLTALPVVPTSGILLKEGEVCHFFDSALRVETKNQVVGYSGGSSGMSVRIMKGVTLHSSSSRGAPIRKDVKKHLNGSLCITSKRIIFSAEKGGFSKTLATLTSVIPYEDGYTFQFGNTSYTIVLSQAFWASQILNGIFANLPIEQPAMESYNEVSHLE